MGEQLELFNVKCYSKTRVLFILNASKLQLENIWKRAGCVSPLRICQWQWRD